MKRKSVILQCTALVLVAVMGLTACGSGESVSTEAKAIQATNSKEDNADMADVQEIEREPLEQIEDADVPQLEGYELLWHDEFNGDTLDESIWSYDPHEPGWTNAELQEYTTSTDNVFVKDGRLILKAIKSQTASGTNYYTSGKVKTQDKKDFLYGKVVARAKVPEGQGLWPAIWMMPTHESNYGNWPKCGEIDIMEVLGNETDLTYSTIHYGEPHAEQQGTYRLPEGSFADGFHEYSVEWEPGEMRFYTDDVLVLTVNDWFTANPGAEESPYPAPFDQTFYLQMNLAVGGTWPGNPDETTDFDRAEFEIDYVRVYQKPEYDTNVTKPEKVFREATSDGNLIYNGDFSDEEALDDEDNWYFLLFEGGKAEAKIKDGVMTITTEDAGDVEYSVQLVQPELPIMKGENYKLSFDACAEADRTIITAITAPTAGWGRYLEDTVVHLTTDWQTFEYEFSMTDKDDNNGRLEFNMGGLGYTEQIQIKNVRLEIVD